MASTSPRGTYVVIAEALRAEIHSAPSPVDLPSEAELQVRYGVSRTTVRRALQVLKADGLIESAPGIGSRSRSGEPQSKPEPLYQRIARDITSEITAGRLAVGGRAPSEGDLHKQYGVSRPTARRALAELEAVGVLEAVHGSGRFVRSVPLSPSVPEPEARS